MPFSVRQIAQDDKLCHQVNLEVLQEVYPRETVEQVLSDCHAWEKREKALSMVAIVYLVIALTLFPVARPQRGSGDRGRDLPTAAAIGRNRAAAVVSPLLSSVGHPEYQRSLLPGPTSGGHRWHLRGCGR